MSQNTPFRFDCPLPMQFQCRQQKEEMDRRHLEQKQNRARPDCGIKIKDEFTGRKCERLEYGKEGHIAERQENEEGQGSKKERRK